ncbi:hypothetical protein DNJ95_18360 [Stutzerimonas kirkiae]|uniref:Uncharacterized protein n=1 Tax=Stutzerimonas kirkiae TaxID=2211392 RepID=A0A4Q9R9J6_9GAMM|nr:hypothetical protein DNJ96_08590 [Stutzerimonas kirkiae]TBU98221.1 hypothetical protein DNJ95_18360 [Stutzerimonas kirkiae]
MMMPKKHQVALLYVGARKALEWGVCRALKSMGRGLDTGFSRESAALFWCMLARVGAWSFSLCRRLPLQAVPRSALPAALIRERRPP